MEKMKEIIRGFGCIIILWEIKKKKYIRYFEKKLVMVYLIIFFRVISICLMLLVLFFKFLFRDINV